MRSAILFDFRGVMTVILGISGSLRRGSLNAKLLDTA